MYTAVVYVTSITQILLRLLNLINQVIYLLAICIRIVYRESNKIFWTVIIVPEMVRISTFLFINQGYHRIITLDSDSNILIIFNRLKYILYDISIFDIYMHY